MSFKARQKSLSLEADFPRGDSSLPEALGPTGNFPCFFVTFFDGHAAPYNVHSVRAGMERPQCRVHSRLPVTLP